MKCPKCNINLVMSERQGIEIDYCPDCRGVWLDRGELDKIIERSGAPFSQGQGQEQEYKKERYSESKSDYHDEKYYKQRKKKSFLDDIFDF